MSNIPTDIGITRELTRILGIGKKKPCPQCRNFEMLKTVWKKTETMTSKELSDFYKSEDLRKKKICKLCKAEYKKRNIGTFPLEMIYERRIKPKKEQQRLAEGYMFNYGRLNAILSHYGLITDSTLPPIQTLFPRTKLSGLACSREYELFDNSIFPWVDKQNIVNKLSLIPDFDATRDIMYKTYKKTLDEIIEQSILARNYFTKLGEKKYPRYLKFYQKGYNAQNQIYIK